jgi:hypothetical protein
VPFSPWAVRPSGSIEADEPLSLRPQRWPSLMHRYVLTRVNWGFGPVLVALASLNPGSPLVPVSQCVLPVRRTGNGCPAAGSLRASACAAVKMVAQDPGALGWGAGVAAMAGARMRDA